MSESEKRLRVLFLCTSNACRSQIAEGWARHLEGDVIEAFSAGTRPAGLDPRAVRVMAEAGVDISGHASKGMEALEGMEFDHVVTVCSGARDACPRFPGPAPTILAGFDDPPCLAENATSEEEALDHYRRVRDEIRNYVESLPDALAGRDTGKGLGVFERYLTVWVVLCILGGMALGSIAPGIASTLDGLSLTVGGAPVVSLPIAVCLFLMMYPIMVKIDFAEVLKAGRNMKPVTLTLVLNWAVKPFTMYGISLLFLGVVFRAFIGAEAMDLVKMPFGLDLAVGEKYGAGSVVVVEGIKMLQVPLWRSYLAGCILLGIAPCTAMVLVWGFLARGNDGHTLVMVAINSLSMLVLYGVLGGFLLGVGQLPVPWEALLLSIGVYVALPLVAGYFTRRWILAARGEAWFRERFLPVLTPVTITALLFTLVLLFSFKGDVILQNPLTILWIAVPLFLQTVLIFCLGYWLAKKIGLSYRDAAPSAMIGASNHFEVAIATAVMLFGLSSGAALATVVGVLIEVPVMLMLVKICLGTRGWFGPEPERASP